MIDSQQSTLAAKYIVDDLPGARQIGSRLHGILKRFDGGSPVSELSRDYLIANGLHCLHSLIEGRTDLQTFNREAVSERAHRIECAKAAAIELAAESVRRKAERAAASAEFFNDPAYLRRQDAKRLRRAFGLDYIEPEHYPRVLKLLRTLAEGKRLRSEDVIWLQTEAEGCWTDAVADAWHLIEADYLTSRWHETGDPWAAINASSHWRRGGKPESAIALTGEALASNQTLSPKVQSALATTRGAAFRTTGRRAEAKELGEQAHALMPGDYRPCTLLGAVNFELGELVEGQAWFMKAEQRGAEKALVDHDIKALLARMPNAERDRIQAFLLEQDTIRFAWLRRGRDSAQRGTRSR